MVYKWLNNAHALAYPARCILCDSPGSNGLDLCTACAQDLPWQRHGCSRCALTLPSPIDLCPACRKHSPPFDAALSPLRYEWPVDWMITQLKFNARLSHARLLAQLLTNALQHLPVADRPQAIIPMPLHTMRWRERGFNQATEIARPLGKTLGIPVWHRATIRTRATEHQADLTARERPANVRGAFAVAPELTARHVAILDDVVTTGATARALALTLKRAGVERVQLWCAARA